jgi:hypothetical protein
VQKVFNLKEFTTINFSTMINRIKRLDDFGKSQSKKIKAIPPSSIIKVQIIWQLSGDKTEDIINELNEALAA